MSSTPQAFTPEDRGFISAARDSVPPVRPGRSERGVRGREHPVGLLLAAFVLAELVCAVFLATTIWR